jgi:hypothetical protein
MHSSREWYLIVFYKVDHSRGECKGAFKGAFEGAFEGGSNVGV